MLLADLQQLASVAGTWLKVLSRTEVGWYPILGEENDLPVLPYTSQAHSEWSQQVRLAQLTAPRVVGCTVIGLFQTRLFYFSFISAPLTCETKRWNKSKVGGASAELICQSVVNSSPSLDLGATATWSRSSIMHRTAKVLRRPLLFGT